VWFGIPFRRLSLEPRSCHVIPNVINTIEPSAAPHASKEKVIVEDEYKRATAPFAHVYVVWRRGKIDQRSVEVDMAENHDNMWFCSGREGKWRGNHQHGSHPPHCSSLQASASALQPQLQHVHCFNPQELAQEFSIAAAPTRRSESCTAPAQTFSVLRYGGPGGPLLFSKVAESLYRCPAHRTVVTGLCTVINDQHQNLSVLC